MYTPKPSVRAVLWTLCLIVIVTAVIGDIYRDEWTAWTYFMLLCVPFNIWYVMNNVIAWKQSKTG
jgi:hypothetical protein